MWQKLAEAAPDVELVPADGWIESLRQVKEPAELERVAASCAVADMALERLLPSIKPGMTEHEVALQLEFEMRTHGAEALAFDVAVLAGAKRGTAARLARANADQSRARCCCSTSVPRCAAIAPT